MPKPPRTRKRGAVYWLRVKVPTDLRAHYAPKTHIEYSLGTKDPRAATERSAVEYLKICQEWGTVRASAATRVIFELTQDQIDRLAALRMAELLEADEQIRLRRFTFPTPQSPEEAHAYYTRLLDHLPVLKKHLSMGDTTFVDLGMDAFLEKHRLRLAENSETRRRLAYAMMKATVRAYEMALQRHQGEAVDTPKVEPLVVPETATGPTLAELYEKRKAEWKPATKTLLDFDTMLRRFTERHKAIAAKAITKKHIVEFKDFLLSLELHPKTINKNLDLLHALLGWAARNEYIPSNPATGVQVAVPKVERKKVIPYSIEDLGRIFRSPVYTAGKRPKGGKGEAAFWLPLLGLWSGARLEELAQLLVADVHRDYLNVTNLDDSQGVKTAGSVRRVPIHPELVRCGFLRYVDRVKASGALRLFPELRQDAHGGWSASWSKWWGRYPRSGSGIR